MRFNSRVVAMSAVLFVSYASVAQARQAELPAPIEVTVDTAGPENAKDQLVRSGVGAELKAKHIGGNAVEGPVESRELRSLALVSLAKGTPDAPEARRGVHGPWTLHPTPVRTAALSKEAEIAIFVMSFLANAMVP